MEEHRRLGDFFGIGEAFWDCAIRVDGYLSASRADPGKAIGWLLCV